MRYDPQIASRFEQMELPIWDESEEFRSFLAGYIKTLPVNASPDVIDRRFVAYVLELTDGVTGRVVDLRRRAAVHAATTHGRRIGLEVLQHVGAPLPTIISQRAWHCACRLSPTLIPGRADKIKRNPHIA
jgi:AAA+ superfamily predicted ATPase